jgi:hypothetical protein
VTLIVLLFTSGAFAQGRVSRAKLALAGQKAIFTVVGNSAPVCLDLAQMDLQGNLLTFSSYYVGALATSQVSAPTIAGQPTTVIFAISEVGSPSPTTACQSVPGSFINDPTREPKIFEQIVGGDGPTITVNQLNGAFALTAALCNQSQSQSAYNNNTQNNNATGGSGVGSGATIVTPVNVNAPVTTQLQGQLCLASNSTSVAQINFSDVNQLVVFGFEELDFEPISGNIFSSLLGGCNSPSVNTAGASFVLTCPYPTGGTFSDQSFH